MSNLDSVMKVADQLISRVFDQRQFTNGEINYLSREIFEGKTNNLEKSFDKLLKVNESVCLIADTNAPDLCINHEAKAKEISDQVGSLVARAERFLRMDEDFRKKEETDLGSLREQLDKKKQDCLIGCRKRLEDLREYIMEEDLELERKYLKFEENLRDKKAT